jgi:hypothetical protein
MTRPQLRFAALILAVVAFSIGAIRPGLAGVDWQNAGLALAVLAIALGE